MADRHIGAVADNDLLAPVVDVIVVNWNSGSHLRACVAALDQSLLAERLNVVVVDNASSDDSLVGLSASRIRLTLLFNADNRGFARGCNQGAQEGCAPYVLFLNPDVRVTPDTIERAVAYLVDPKQSEIGILGVQLVDAEGLVHRSCARTPSQTALLLRCLFLDRLCPSLVSPHFLFAWDHQDTRTVDQVIGAFLLVRRAVFRQVGGFDPRYFLYYEDVDLCLTARRAGWQVVYFSGVRAEHAGGGSTGGVKGKRLYHLAVSKAEYTAKWHGPLAARLVIMFTLGFEFPTRWLHAVVCRSPQEGRSVRQAMALLCKDLRDLTCRIGVRAR